jgi:hypothetical protein
MANSSFMDSMANHNVQYSAQQELPHVDLLNFLPFAICQYRSCIPKLTIDALTSGTWHLQFLSSPAQTTESQITESSYRLLDDTDTPNYTRRKGEVFCMWTGEAKPVEWLVLFIDSACVRPCQGGTTSSST